MARCRILKGLLLGCALVLSTACGDDATTSPDAGDADADHGDTPGGDADADADADANADADADADVTPDVPWDAARFYVSPLGDDSHPGTLGEPFRTLGRARDAVREVRATEGLPTGGLVVALREGVYDLTGSFSLAAEDSGEDGAPIWYAAYPDENARLTGSTGIPASAIVPVPSDSPARSRLPAAAAGRVVRARQRHLGLRPLGPDLQAGRRLRRLRPVRRAQPDPRG